MEQLSKTELPNFFNIGQTLEIKGKVIESLRDTLLQKRYTYECRKCKTRKTIETDHNTHFQQSHPACPNRAIGKCRKSMVRLDYNCSERNTMKYKEIRMQELESDGHYPRTFVVTLEGDLGDKCLPGTFISLKGTVERRKMYNPTIHTSIVIRATQVECSDHMISPYDDVKCKSDASTRWFELVSKCGELRARDELINSMFPEMLGLHYVKLALALVLCGSVDRMVGEDIEVRSQIHLLLSGGPGSGKSTLLQKATSYIRPSFYASRASRYIVGLEVYYISRSPLWHLKSGILVLCNGGILCLDQIDQISDREASNLESIIETRRVPIQNTNADAYLPVQCSIIGTTSTEDSRYKQMLLNNFDLVLELGDELNEIWDKKLIDFVLGNSEDHHQCTYSQEQIQKHLALARTMNPTIEGDALELLLAYFKEYRENPAINKDSKTNRLKKNLIKLATAHAKLLCRNQVTVYDSITAILLMESSIGFGKLYEPLQIIQTDLPLEPSRKTCLKLLGKFNMRDFYKPEEYNCSPKEPPFVMAEEPEDEDDGYLRKILNNSEQIRAVFDGAAKEEPVEEEMNVVGVEEEADEILLEDQSMNDCQRIMDSDEDEHLSQLSYHDILNRINNAPPTQAPFARDSLEDTVIEVTKDVSASQSMSTSGNGDSITDDVDWDSKLRAFSEDTFNNDDFMDDYYEGMMTQLMDEHEKKDKGTVQKHNGPRTGALMDDTPTMITLFNENDEFVPVIKFPRRGC